MNVVLLVTDDQRPDTIAALGNEFIRTPNLDALARRGVSFTRAVCPYPLCVPSRAEMFTGRDSFNNGMTPGGKYELRDDLVFLPEALRRAGYQTCYVGKWHTPGLPSRHGFDESRAFFRGGFRNPPDQVDANGRPVTGYRGWVFQTEQGEAFPELGVGLTPDINARFADAAIEYIGQRRDSPYFIQVNFTGPHDPLLWPTEFRDAYRADRLPLPLNYLPEHPFDHGNLRGRDESLLPWPRSPDNVRAELAVYYAVISHIDQQVGRIVEALRRADQLSRTLIIFTSDHGLAIGSHGLRGKQNMYEHTIGVPLIVSGPSIPKGERNKAQVYSRDLYPTICELVGAPIPETVTARSFASAARGRTERGHAYAFAYFHGFQRMIRGDRWKLIHYPGVDRWQLFDLARDPHELTDLSDSPDSAPVMRDLRAKLAAWQRTVGDPFAAEAP